LSSYGTYAGDMDDFPQASASFADKKKRILDQLSLPDSEYQDASPKGSIDEGIRDLIDEINSVDGLVTTSSCAGRVSIFLDGRKTRLADDAGAEQVAGVGGKGSGGKWLYISHEPIANGDGSRIIWAPLLDEVDENEGPVPRRLIYFKFEPMVRLESRVFWPILFTSSFF
jgi:tRNA wybutosine-synthesizing protein 3